MKKSSKKSAALFLSAALVMSTLPAPAQTFTEAELKIMTANAVDEGALPAVTTTKTTVTTSTTTSASPVTTAVTTSARPVTTTTAYIMPDLNTYKFEAITIPITMKEGNKDHIWFSFDCPKVPTNCTGVKLSGTFSYSTGSDPKDKVTINWNAESDNLGNCYKEIDLSSVPANVTSAEFCILTSKAIRFGKNELTDYPCQLYSYGVWMTEDSLTTTLPPNVDLRTTTTTTTATTTPPVRVDGTSGTCGENAAWKIEDGTLTISGTGEVKNVDFYNLRAYITKVVVEKGITNIPNELFSYCYKLESVNLPDSVTRIGEYAFYNCESLESITIPDSVTSIGYCTFSNCTNLKSITIPDSVTRIGDKAFYLCTSLESIIIPDSVTRIGYSTFSNCTNLKSITISDSVTSIGNYAFYCCENLKSINIPDAVTRIEYGTFNFCSNLESITIPDSVTSIDNCAFEGCTVLKSITIPGSVTSIGESAFAGCASLKSITIPDAVTSIRYGTFSNCTNLESISFLNPNCKIYDSEYTINKTIAITGYKGSTAETYAKKFGRTFVALEGEPPVAITTALATTTTTVDWRKTTTTIATFTTSGTYVLTTSVHGNQSTKASTTTNASTTTSTTPASTNAPVKASLYGDANCDGKVSIADAVAVLQHIANKDKFGLTTQGQANADVDGIAGITGNDALVIQKVDAGLYKASDLPLKA